MGKYLKDVQSLSYRCCIELDEAFTHEPNEEEVLWRVAGVVWRHVFNKSEEVCDEHVMAFAK